MKQYNPVEVEHEILNFWAKNKIYEKQKKQYASSKKRWSFIDGPITANNPMGVHHAWGRTLKDLFLRWKAMQRYNVRRQNGFDCQGLWVEVEVEKEKGFKSTKDIEDFGIKNFVTACRERIERMAKKQTEQSIRLGQWMDWDNSYYTHLDQANEYKWMFLKFCHEKGWLYKGVDVVPWCPRCSCTESKHAVATEGYWNETDKAVYIKAPITGKPKEYFLIWTTSPWAIPANVAVAINPDLYYVRVKCGNEIYYIVEERAHILGKDCEVLDRVRGDDLVGVHYEWPYKDLSAQRGAIMSGAKEETDIGDAPHVIVAWAEVSATDGTGMVTIAPGCGPEDYQLGKTERLPAPNPLDKSGVFVEGYGKFSGLPVKDANKAIYADLDERGFVLKFEDYTHSFPHCTRCKTPLVFRLVPEWYIHMEDIRPKLIEENQKINWVPPQGKSYEDTWLHNMDDWLISRKRYWGLPLPFWECECGELTVVGSKKELKKLAVKGFDKLKELHRPWIDDVIIKCPKCGKKVKRVVDTGDVWLDAGMVPFFTLNWLTDKKYFNQWYPADFITECGPGQYRCWFYSMLLHGVALTGKYPFKSVLTNELVKDEKGNEMHKSSGNAIWFDEAADKAGSDVMRWLYCCHDPATELLFGWTALDEKRKALNVLWNFGNYLQIYLDKKPSKPAKPDVKAKWLFSRLESLKKTVTQSLESLQPNVAALAIEDFFLNDLSRGYGHFVRDEMDSPLSVYVCYKALLDTLVLMAPFVPFVTEKIYQEIFRKFEKAESIHLFEWPKADEKSIDAGLEYEIKSVQEVISAVLSAREKMNRGVRWPIKSVTVATHDQTVKAAVNKHAELIKQMTNALESKPSSKLQAPSSKLTIKPDYSKLGPKLGKHVAEFIGKVVVMSPETILAKLDKGELKMKLDSGGEAAATRSDFIIKEELPADLVMAEGAGFSVYLDTNETEEMLASGFAREITRKVQDLRKKAGLVKKDGIALAVEVDDKLIQKELLEQKDKIGATRIDFSSVKGKAEELKVRGKVFKIGFAKAK